MPEGEKHSEVVVGKLCRSCVDFSTWVREQQRKRTGGEKGPPAPAATIPVAPPPNCPLDKDELGRASWAFLHTMAAHYPAVPTGEDEVRMRTFIELFAEFYPCDFCAEDMRRDVRERPPKTGSGEEFAKWMCEMHNRVNKKLGKGEFDCNLVRQRWRDGWEDGSCD